jgi:hypothetical protein
VYLRRARVLVVEAEAIKPGRSKAYRRKQARIGQVLTLLLPTRHASVTQKTKYVWMRLGLARVPRGRQSVKNAFDAMDCDGKRRNPTQVVSDRHTESEGVDAAERRSF